MKLNHLNLVVADVAAAASFFGTHFGFSLAATKGDNMLAVLEGEGGIQLVLMSAAMSKERSAVYPAAFHIGFMLDSEAQVREKYRQLKDAGIPLEREPQNIRGSLGFYFHLDGIMIEIGMRQVAA